VIAIVDYRAGNLTSVKLAFEALGADCRITSDAGEIRRAERVVFPGVGAAGAGMKAIAELGLGPVLRDVIGAGTPFLGVCFGMQLLFEHSAEDGGVDCLGILPGRVRRFAPSSPREKIPHMGWNAVAQLRDHPLLEGIENGIEFYFVHGYYCEPSDPKLVIGRTDYAGVAFCSAVGRANLFATQFHPERSGRFGLRLYRNFAGWDGTDPC